MNNLKNVMAAKNVKPAELAQLANLPVSTVRRLMANPDATPHNDTAKLLADALGVSIAQIYGAKPAEHFDKDLLIKTIVKHATALADALRAYSDETLYLHLSVISNDEENKERDSLTPDYFSFVCELEANALEDPEGITPANCARGSGIFQRDRTGIVNRVEYIHKAAGND